MTIHAFYIFDRHCSCIYSREYAHPSITGSKDSINGNNKTGMAQLLFGTLYSLKIISTKLGDTLVGNKLRSFCTGIYRVHFYESLSNFKFVIVTDLEVETLQLQLMQLYSVVFLNNVVMNALSPVEFGDLKISNQSFITLSDAYIRLLPVFQ